MRQTKQPKGRQSKPNKKGPRRGVGLGVLLKDDTEEEEEEVFYMLQI